MHFLESLRKTVIIACDMWRTSKFKGDSAITVTDSVTAFN